MNNDKELFRRFCDLGAEMLESAFRASEASDPELFAAVQRAVGEGRGTVEMVVRFAPRLNIAVRIVENDGGGIVEFCQLSDRPEGAMQ